MDIRYYLEILLRLVVSAILGGIIGYERENTRRPAGFRTHILVCVGSALVMVTSEYIFEMYRDASNLDPSRLGAQVISGIGFLGAGTIIRNGFNVKGLTTAASLWAVACVGIAAGIGFYEGAVFASLLIFITLKVLKAVEHRVSSKYRTIHIIAEDRKGLLGELGNIFDANGISVKKIDHIEEENEEENEQYNLSIRFAIKIPASCKFEKIMESIYNLDSVVKVFEK